MASSNAEKTVSLKVWIDKELNRVVFAESESDLVDVLFSFLTLPIGNIIRLLRERQPSMSIGCFNSLYTSLETLETRYFKSEGCKSMLLRPRNSSWDICRKLKLNMDDTEQTKYYICSCYHLDRVNCNAHCSDLLSTIRNIKCNCGVLMDREVNLENPIVDIGRSAVICCRNDDIFNNRRYAEFIIYIFLFAPLFQILGLLGQSLVSKTPLTDVFLMKQENPTNVMSQHISTTETPRKEDTTSNNQEITVKITVRKSSGKVVFAEAGENFVSFLFNLLAFPLGSISKLLGPTSLFDCVSNLYKSVQGLAVGKYIRSEDLKEMLLSPKLAPQFGWSNQPLVIDEKQFLDTHYYTTWNGHVSTGRLTTTTKDLYGCYTNSLTFVKPSMTGTGNGFLEGPVLFLVTDDLVVTPLSVFPCISFLGSQNIPFNDLEEREVSIGMKEVRYVLLCTSFMIIMVFLA
ncbi:hypothetical protein GIB67_007620 [Kingdonia uniflora]|uniref:DUF674 family protein n=1 Tax=Kingdonia uniflora TaxID=39325 RepID=A0A7J7N1B1_9MAGN|nr:hypothetical protein GIB67_007620 [Kingdonia uniflora]